MNSITTGMFFLGLVFLTACSSNRVDFVHGIPNGNVAPANAALYTLPMYGADKGIVKTQAMIDADNKFMQDWQKAGYSAEQAYELSIMSGWKFLPSDLSKAIQYFNQAWLINPDKAESYHGFAVVSAERKLPEPEVTRYFNLAISKSELHATIFVDYGRYLWTQKHNEQALIMLHKALQMDPKAKNAQRHLAFIADDMGSKDDACKYGEAALANHDEMIDQGTVDQFCHK